VIVMGTWLTVKEQMADGYAARLADRGYTAVTLDFAGSRASGGDLRQTGIPTRKIADIAAVVEFVSRSLAAVCGGRSGVVDRLARADRAAAHDTSTGLLPTVPAYAPGDDRAGMLVELPYDADPHRGAEAEVVRGTGTQIDFYDRPAQMTFAIDAVDALPRRSPAVPR
jgi:uncharacterized protein